METRYTCLLLLLYKHGMHLKTTLLHMTPVTFGGFPSSLGLGLCVQLTILLVEYFSLQAFLWYFFLFLLRLCYFYLHSYYFRDDNDLLADLNFCGISSGCDKVVCVIREKETTVCFRDKYCVCWNESTALILLLALPNCSPE